MKVGWVIGSNLYLKPSLNFKEHGSERIFKIASVDSEINLNIETNKQILPLYNSSRYPESKYVCIVNVCRCNTFVYSVND